jgi:hypothetical protein
MTSGYLILGVLFVIVSMVATLFAVFGPDLIERLPPPHPRLRPRSRHRGLNPARRREHRVRESRQVSR